MHDIPGASVCSIESSVGPLGVGAPDLLGGAFVVHGEVLMLEFFRRGPPGGGGGAGPK